MDKDKQTLLIGFVVLVVVVLVASSLGLFTGKAVKEESQVMAKLHLSSNEAVADEDNLQVRGGQWIYITAETGSNGINNGINIVDQSRGFKAATLTFRGESNCGTTLCIRNKIASMKYQVQYGWKGNYCVVIRDRVTGKDIQKCFGVI